MSAHSFMRMVAGRQLDDGFLEVRHPQPGGSWHCEFFPVSRAGDAADYALRVGTAFDAYAGMGVRVRRRGTAEDVMRSWAISVDCDDDHALRALDGFRPQPSVIVESGGATAAGAPRLQAHWPLKEPVAREEFEDAKRRLAQRLGSDRRVSDAARVMRIPGTSNFKKGKPHPVVCVRFEPVTFSTEEVVGSVERGPGPVCRAHGDSGRQEDALLQIPAIAYIEALTGRRPDRTGYVRCPLHKNGQERTPSLKPDGTLWVCFGDCEPVPPATCLGGSIYTFAAALWDYPLPLRDVAFLQVRSRLHETMSAHLGDSEA